MPPNFLVTYFLWGGENSRKSDIDHHVILKNPSTTQPSYYYI